MLRRLLKRLDHFESLGKPTLSSPVSAPSPAGGDVVEREVAAQAALARIKGLRDQYADQAKFADVDEARLFRQFVERLDRAALSPSTSAAEPVAHPDDLAVDRFAAPEKPTLPKRIKNDAA